jgi:hypothetical protein
MGGTVEDWATESLLAARAAYQERTTGRRIKPGTKLADTYYNVNLPVARQPALPGQHQVGGVLGKPQWEEAIQGLFILLAVASDALYREGRG